VNKAVTTKLIASSTFVLALLQCLSLIHIQQQGHNDNLLRLLIVMLKLKLGISRTWINARASSNL